MIDLGLEGVHVLVTGANGGIGLPTVKLFLEQGALVTALYNSTSAELDADPYVISCKAEDKVRTIALDVTKEEAVNQAFEDLFPATSSSKDPNGWPPLNCLVVNHGIFTTPSVPVWDMTLAQFERTQRINLVGPFLLIRAFLKGYQTHLASLSPEEDIAPPNIVIIGSTSAEFGEAGHADYSTSKSGLTHGLMKSVKNEIVKIHPRGRINSVSPGWVATGMAEESLKDEETKWRATATTPMKKIATPLEVAYQILVMSSDRISGHTTGQIVMVAGGMEGRLLNPKP